jgi:hypothetical protein
VERAPLTIQVSLIWWVQGSRSGGAASAPARVFRSLRTLAEAVDDLIDHDSE